MTAPLRTYIDSSILLMTKTDIPRPRMHQAPQQQHCIVLCPAHCLRNSARPSSARDLHNLTYPLSPRARPQLLALEGHIVQQRSLLSQLLGRQLLARLVPLPPVPPVADMACSRQQEDTHRSLVPTDSPAPSPGPPSSPAPWGQSMGVSITTHCSHRWRLLPRCGFCGGQVEHWPPGYHLLLQTGLADISPSP